MKKTTRDKILYLLKSRGAQTATLLATELKLTSMGARQQLLKLSKQGEIDSYTQSSGSGRPKKFWQLTKLGQKNFPDRHADLTLEIIDSVQALFGTEGLERLIESREESTYHKYSTILYKQDDLYKRLCLLAEIRSNEGYMATIESSENGYLLIEDHCPICAAAQMCQGFCRSELELFQSLFTDLATVERTEHQLSNARRCAYQVLPSTSNKAII